MAQGMMEVDNLGIMLSISKEVGDGIGELSTLFSLATATAGATLAEIPVEDNSNAESEGVTGEQEQQTHFNRFVAFIFESRFALSEQIDGKQPDGDAECQQARKATEAAADLLLRFVRLRSTAGLTDIGTRTESCAIAAFSLHDWLVRCCTQQPPQKRHWFAGKHCIILSAGSRFAYCNLDRCSLTTALADTAGDDHITNARPFR